MVATEGKGREGKEIPRADPRGDVGGGWVTTVTVFEVSRFRCFDVSMFQCVSILVSYSSHPLGNPTSRRRAIMGSSHASRFHPFPSSLPVPVSLSPCIPRAVRKHPYCLCFACTVVESARQRDGMFQACSRVGHSPAHGGSCDKTRQDQARPDQTMICLPSFDKLLLPLPLLLL